MSYPFVHVNPGDAFVPSASLRNATVDLIRAAERKTKAPSNSLRGIELLYAQVRNDTGKALPRFSIVGLAGPVAEPGTSFNEFSDQILFRGVVPSSEHAGKCAVTLEGLGRGAIGRACLTGAVQAKIKSDDDTVDTCDVIEGETGYLKSGGKIDVLWIEPPGNPEKPRWAIVRLGGGSGAAAAPAAPVLYGTIMEDVPPTDHSDVDYRFGKVSVLGKTYGPTDSNESVNDGNPIVYDYCVCLETSFESDEYLIQNTFVKLTGPYKMDDPDADPESEEPPDQVDFYVAVEIDREYIAEIDSDIYKSTDSTIQVGGHSFKVFGDLIPPDSYIPAGFGVRVRRTTGTTVPRLCVIAGKCPAKIQEEQ